ncbi:MAG: glycosyltransferase [Bacteroidales bacterium]|nr:glycosyltransferase [Bacteroidales bacterium]
MQQIFQSPNSTRWNRFVWFVRILLVFILVGVLSIVLSLTHQSHYDAKSLIYKEKRIRNVNINPSKKAVSDSELVAYALHLKKIRSEKRYEFYNQKIERGPLKEYLPLRAGFYVNWDKNSFSSLESNVDKLNMVLPEWFFQKNTKGDLDIKINAKALNIMYQNDVAIIPILSNNINQHWNGDSTAQLLKSPKYRAKLISNIKSLLKKYHFQGINVDLENIPQAMASYRMIFSRELYQALHPAGYLLTIDVNPFDKTFDYKELNTYYDLIFLMAYDEHFAGKSPGCITSVKFIEQALDLAMKEVPSEKFVLCLAGYGYDWKAGQNGKSISYDDFISLSAANNAPVNFDDDHSDLYINYYDENGNPGEAHCTDATTIFNSIRTAEEYHTAGVSLWHLGTEDPRIWSFYNRSLSADSLKKHPFNYKQLEKFKSASEVNFTGSGEILEIASEPEPGSVKIKLDVPDQMIENESYQSLPTSYLINRFGKPKGKEIALTFDDGPDEDFTPEILDILKENKIPATFFVVGVNIEKNLSIIRRMYKEGHEIGNHTFTHPDLEITSKDRERVELRSTRLLLESIIGHSTLLFRPPYNTDAEPQDINQIRPLSIAKDEGYLTIASSIDPNDWQIGVTDDTIVARVFSQQNLGNILLLHDAGGNRSQTVLALPRIINFYRQKGYQFVTISDIMGRTRDQVMPTIKGNARKAENFDYIFFLFTSLFENFLHGFFVVAIVLGISRILILMILAILQHRKFQKEQGSVPSDYKPKVSVIVPAYNEELTVTRTIENLLKSDYPLLDIVFVDDGSKDQTFANVKAAFSNIDNVQILTKPNGGKASALNFGIASASGEILVCIDADTLLLPDAISKMVPFFVDEEVGAVAGNVQVGNAVNFLTNWQKMEYITSQNFERRALDEVNAILVVPGAIGAFRKTAIDRIKGFTIDTLAEDCDLTVRLHRAGFKVHSCNDAISFTEAPETMKMFLKQRFRWTFGMMQTFWKHRDLLFSLRKPNIGWIMLPNLLVFGFIIPLFSPLVDFFFIIGLFSTHVAFYVLTYVLFFLVDWIVSAFAYRYDGKKFSLMNAATLFIQRFVYRQIFFYILIKSYLKAMKGELASWGILKRTGNVKLNQKAKI